MEENNRIKNEKVLEKVQGGVNLNGAASSELIGNLASQKIGVHIPIHSDAKNTGGGNVNIFNKGKN